jgi:hypothetical protein
MTSGGAPGGVVEARRCRSRSSSRSISIRSKKCIDVYTVQHSVHIQRRNNKLYDTLGHQLRQGLSRRGQPVAD